MDPVILSDFNKKNHNLCAIVSQKLQNKHTFVAESTISAYPNFLYSSTKFKCVTYENIDMYDSSSLRDFISGNSLGISTIDLDLPLKCQFSYENQKNLQSALTIVQ